MYKFRRTKCIMIKLRKIEYIPSIIEANLLDTVQPTLVRKTKLYKLFIMPILKAFQTSRGKRMMKQTVFLNLGIKHQACRLQRDDERLLTIMRQYESSKAFKTVRVRLCMSRYASKTASTTAIY